MNALVWIPGLTSVLALVFSLALFDQWRVRRQPFQLIWALGMLFYGIASGCEAIGGASLLRRCVRAVDADLAVAMVNR